MGEKGANLTASGSSGSSNIYKIRVKNESSSSVTITLGVGVGLDYNDLSLPSNGHLFEEAKRRTVADYVLEPGENGSTYDDGEDTFITGEDPNNYIWYSGKLWRAVSVNNDAKTTKLVTQWNISAISYDDDSGAFEESHMEDWLNDTSIDGFLGNLRDYENFIVTDSVWDATLGSTELGSITRPNGTTTVTDAVGLLNIYEYQSSYTGTTYGNGYLNNGLWWWTLTPCLIIENFGNINRYTSVSSYTFGIRPSINLKFSVKIVDGNGTLDNPYRLEGDNDSNLSGTMLNTRYSGEYVRFGNDENNLYRIVSHENGTGTKIVSAEPLKSSGTFITSAFGSSNIEVNYSTNSVIGTFLNGEYLNSYVDSTYSDMIEDSTTWYLGTVGSGASYKLAKYRDTSMSGYVTTTDAKVGLLRYGELMAGQFDIYTNDIWYWTLTPYNSYNIRTVYVDNYGRYVVSTTNSVAVKPTINLKSNVIITGGLGTKEQPFEITIQ